MTTLQLRAKLYARDETIASWARRRGYATGTVQRVLHRWGAATGVPRGRITRAILRDMSHDIGEQIPPGIDWAAADAVPTDPRRRAAGTPKQELRP